MIFYIVKCHSVFYANLSAKMRGFGENIYQEDGAPNDALSTAHL